MKTYAAALAVLIALLVLQGQGIAQVQKEKKAMNESGNIALAQAGSAAWKNFEKPDDATLKKRLTPLQYEVTQKEGTEPPFRNEYDGNKREGIYVDIVSGEPLFSSLDKYDSKTGWPSFTKPLEPGNIVTKKDWSFLGVRTEVRSKRGDSHLGHVFDDGPPPTGLRYCMNSAALRFIPKEELEKEGYVEYLKLFEKTYECGSPGAPADGRTPDQNGNRDRRKRNGDEGTPRTGEKADQEGKDPGAHEKAGPGNRRNWWWSSPHHSSACAA